MFSKNSKIKIFFCFFMAIYFFTVWNYSVNIPYGDDYDGILLAVTNMAQAKNFRDFLTYLFSTHNDGRLVVTYGLSYLQYFFSGQLNFKWLILIGDLFRIGIFFLIYEMLPAKKSVVFACLLILFVFQLKDWENIFWAMSCLPIYSVIFFVFLSLFLLNKGLCENIDTKQSILIFCAASISSVVAIFSYGNGIFIALLGSSMLLWNKRYIKFFIYLIIMALSLCLYCYGYSKSNDIPVFRTDTILYVLTFLGGVVRSHFFSPLLGIMGVLWALFNIVCMHKQRILKNNLFFYYLLFIGMSAVTAAIYRVGVFGIAQALDSRYAIYSILFFAILFSWNVIGKDRYDYILCFIMLLFFIINTPQGIHRQKLRVLQLESYHQKANFFSGLVFPSQEVANNILFKAKAGGIYHLPTATP